MEKHESEEIEDVGRERVEDVSRVMSEYVPDTPEEKALVRKIDLMILPAVWLMYLLSYMDRTNIGNAKVAGMQDDLKLDSSRYSISLVVFFVGYVVMEIPSNIVLARSRPSKFLPAIMILWGSATIGMGFVPNYEDLIVLRVVVGILEAGFAPGVMLLLASWYKKSEMSKRFAIYISAAILSGAFGGLIGGFITSTLDGVNEIAGWRWLFLVEGAVTVGWALISFFLLPDFPETTRCLSGRERWLAVERLVMDHAVSCRENNATLGHGQALLAAVTNWRLWFFVVGYMGVVGSSTISYFYPTLVEGLGYTATTSQYMTIPIYAVAFVANLISGYFSDRYPSFRGLILSGLMAVAMICAIITCIVYDCNARYALIVIMASGLWAGNGLALSYAGANFSGTSHEIKAISLAIVNGLGNLAQIYGSYMFPSVDETKYIKGFGVISGLCLTGVLSYVALHILLRRFPKKY